MLDGRVTMELEDGGERMYVGPVSFDIDEPVAVSELAESGSLQAANTTLIGRFGLSSL